MRWPVGFRLNETYRKRNGKSLIKANHRYQNPSVNLCVYCPMNGVTDMKILLLSFPFPYNFSTPVFKSHKTLVGLPLFNLLTYLLHGAESFLRS